MFVDLMNDISETFTDRFLKVQLIVEPGPPADNGAGAYGDLSAEPARPAPTKRYNALGVLEDVVDPSLVVYVLDDAAAAATGVEEVLDVGPAETPAPERSTTTKRDPVIVGAGRTRTLSEATEGGSAPVDWSSVGRNDPCPCGSGKKFKKCHGATL